MYWVDVDGYRLPKLVGSHPALDLCNTWAGWAGPVRQRKEYLVDFDRLAVWTGHAHLLDADTVRTVRRLARRQPAQADAALVQARRLRTALHDTLLDPKDQRAFRRVAGHAHQAASAAVLHNDSSGIARWTLPAGLGVDLPLLACARAAADLLCSPRRGAVRACPGDGCGWLFLDSRGRRRWCIMAVCGNRAKARSYASRHRTVVS